MQLKDVEISHNENKPKKTLWEKRLIAKRILIGSSLALAISCVSGMISSTIHQDEIANLREEQNKIYAQYMQSDEFKTYSKTQLNDLADKYYSGEIDYETFKSELDKIYSIENADKLLEGSSHELKDDIEQLDKQIAGNNKKYENSAINIGNIALLATSAAVTIPSSIAFLNYDLKTVAKSKIIEENEQNLTK